MPSATSLERYIPAAGAYIDDVHDLLKNSGVPTSGMLVQGVLFGGLTMLVTSRTSFTKIPRQTLLPLLLVDYPAWTRRCVICLAIMNEHWTHTLPTKLTGQFEVLADGALRMISTALLSAPIDTSVVETQQTSNMGTETSSIYEIEDLSSRQDSCIFQEQVPYLMETYDSFAELVGPNGTSSSWEFLLQDMDLKLHAELSSFDDEVISDLPSAD
jgi:hypothetical protein